MPVIPRPSMLGAISVAFLALAAPRQPLHAQGSASSVDINVQASLGKCGKTAAAASGAKVLAAECGVANSGSSAMGRVVHGPNGRVEAWITTGENETGLVRSSASYTQRFSLSGGDVSNIYRIVATSTANVLFPAGFANPFALLDIGSANADGSRFNSFFATFADTPTGPFGSAFSATFFTAGGNGLNNFFFTIAATSISQHSDVASRVIVNAPTIALFDQEGRDITRQFAFDFSNEPVTTTPEPASLALIATGIAGLAGYRARRSKKAIERS